MTTLRPALRIEHRQQLTLTPQLRQSIRLLAMSTAELELELAEAAEINPLLEYLAPGEREDASDEQGGTESASDPESQAAERTTDERAAADASATDWNPDDDSSESHDSTRDNRDSEAAADREWDEGEARSTAGSGGDSMWEERLTAAVDLVEHLRRQIELLPFVARDRVIAAVLVDALDEDGLLRVPDSEIAAACALSPPLANGEIESVRHRLQRLDPTGIASRTLIECLDVQLMERPNIGAEARARARRLLLEHSDSIRKVPSEKLAAQLDCAVPEMERALELLRSLDPRPGQRFSAARIDYVQPDVIAYRAQGRWDVRLNGAAHPGLSLNRHYARMAEQVTGTTERYLRGRLQEARWLIRSVAARGDTLLRVAAWIVRQQAAFLDFGAEAMRPLTLREVGAALELHESTVSRATARKYLATPRGVFELRHFFSAALETETGGTASALAVQALIRKLIDAEDPRQPLSDAALARLLSAEGIAVARRTVAKYREGMRIPSSNERCGRG